MMRWIVGSSLRFRYIIIALGVGLMYFGFQRLRDLPVDVFPEFAPVKVEIQTICLGLSPTEVESLVTVPLENAVNGVPGITELRSKSVPQLSSIVALFRSGTNELLARQLVSERIDVASRGLPTWAAPPVMMPPLSSTSRVMKIGVASDELSLVELSGVAYWTIAQRLMRVPGVAHVDIYGERLQQRHVQVDPRSLAAYGLSLQQVMDAGAETVDAGVLQHRSSFNVGAGGFVEDAARRLSIRLVQPVVGPKQLAEVPIARRDGRTLRFKDIGRVVEDHQPTWGDAVDSEIALADREALMDLSAVLRPRRVSIAI